MKRICSVLLKAFTYIRGFFTKSADFCETLLCFAESGFYRTKVDYEKKPYINLIVNGPSVNSVKHLFGLDSKFTERPSIVVNFFANTPEYEIVRPEYYTLADPMFFQDTPGKSVEKVKKFYKTLNDRTKWPLTIFIPKSYGKKKFYEYSLIDNDNINVVEINGIGYDGFEAIRNWSYKHGFCAPRAYTVAIMALYACVQMGFQQIDIYGLDNNYYASLSLTNEGVVCDVMQHNGEPDEYRKILDGKGNPVTLHDYLLGITYHLKNHEIMNEYAKYRGAIIFNHSPITMVDAYPRKLD